MRSRGYSVGGRAASGQSAACARVTKQTAGALVDQLERAGYVVRTRDPSDARARLVTLSDKGLALCRIAGAEAAKVEDEWREFLGERRYAQLRDALTALREITDPYRGAGISD